jgi:hypothetical protein
MFSSSSPLVFLLLLSFIFFTSSVSSSHPELQEGTYEIHEGTLLSQDWKVAALSFDTKEELYFPLIVPCFTCFSSSSFEEKNDEGKPCVCDFSRSGEDCGRAPSGCPKDTCSESDLEKFCYKAKDAQKV